MTDTDSKWDWLPYIIATIAALILLGFILWIDHVEGKHKELNAGFEGACVVLHGEVHADLCVKGSKVVLTKDAYKKVAK